MLLPMPTKYAILQVVYKVLARFKAEVKANKRGKSAFYFTNAHLSLYEGF